MEVRRDGQVVLDGGRREHVRFFLLCHDDAAGGSERWCIFNLTAISEINTFSPFVALPMGIF